MAHADGPIRWQQDGERRWAGSSPQGAPLFWIQRETFLNHPDLPVWYRWTLTSAVPGLDLEVPAEGERAPQELFSKAEQAWRTLNGEG